MMYLGFSSVVALLIITNASSFGAFGFVAILLAAMTIATTLIINYADFVLFPVFTTILGIKITAAKNCYMPKSSNCIIKYVDGIYYATGFLTANVYNYIMEAEVVDETEDQKLGEAPDKWERIVMNVDFPFRYNMIMAAQDIQVYRDELEGKRGVMEVQLSREMGSSTPNQLTIQDLEKKMNILDARIERLSMGERPVNSMMYIETTSVGVSEKEAVDSLTNQLNHLQTIFNAFDLSITRVVGREIYYMFTFGYSLPDIETLTRIFSIQK